MNEYNLLTDAELKEIEFRCNAASPDPWKSWVEGRDHSSGENVITTGGEDIYLNGATIADQDFIAHARQDIPKLILEIKRPPEAIDRK
jgi:hypothetical protein